MKMSPNPARRVKRKNREIRTIIKYFFRSYLKNPTRSATPSNKGLGIRDVKKIIGVEYTLKTSSSTLNQSLSSNFLITICLVEYPKKKDTVSPRAVPREAISATSSGG